MVESRWLRSIGPGLVAVAAVGLVASTTLGAGDRPWVPRACAGPPVTVAAAAARPDPKTLAELRAEPWYRLDPVLDGDGALRGQRLVSGIGGRRGGMPAGGLARESFAAGPFGRIVLVGSDDGAASRLHAVDPSDGCAWLLARSERSSGGRRSTQRPHRSTRRAWTARAEPTSACGAGRWMAPVQPARSCRHCPSTTASGGRSRRRSRGMRPVAGWPSRRVARLRAGRGSSTRRRATA